MDELLDCASFDAIYPEPARVALEWIEQRKARILPTSYYHVVFTLPSELRALALRNRERVHDLLFQCASQSLLELVRDPTWLGARIGVTAVSGAPEPAPRSDASGEASRGTESGAPAFAAEPAPKLCPQCGKGRMIRSPLSVLPYGVDGAPRSPWDTS